MHIAYNSTNEELECLATTHVDELSRKNLVYLLNHLMQRLDTSADEAETSTDRVEELEGEQEMLHDRVAELEHDRDTAEDDLAQLKQDIKDLL